MQKTQSKILTEDALVAELQARGYDDITKRKIEEWRRAELLPAFDQKGAGLGRGAGREPGGWREGELIVSQAAWVSDLLRVYNRTESAYLPLWMLGYPVPLKLVKWVLRQPFDKVSEGLEDEFQEEMEEHGGLALEDFLDGAVDAACRNARKDGLPGFQVSPVMMKLVSNLFLNPEYDLEDEPFTRTVEAFKLRAARRKNQPPSPTDENAANLFEFAPFIKEHLSFGKIKAAVRRCTYADLRVIARDLEIMRETLFHLRRMLKALLSAVPEEFTERFRDVWHALFTVGGLVILVDLSLRRSGFGAWVDQALMKMLDGIRAECTEGREAELRASSKQFFESAQAATEELTRMLAAKVEHTQPRKGRKRKAPEPELTA